MNLGITFLIYMFLVRNCALKVTNSMQVLEINKELKKSEHTFSRIRRQVVQPEWTSNARTGNLFVDYNVRVTEKKLQETEALRDMIQEKIDSDSYAVKLKKSKVKNANTTPNTEVEIQSEQMPDVQSETQSKYESETGSSLMAEGMSTPKPVEDISDPEPASEPGIEYEQGHAWKETDTKQKLQPQFQGKLKPIPNLKPVPSALSCLFFKKGAGCDLINSPFSKWLKKICLPPWCKVGVQL